MLGRRTDPGVFAVRPADAGEVADRRPRVYSFDAWAYARSGGARLLWRISASVGRPLGPGLPDGSDLSVLIAPKPRRGKRERLISAARAGQVLEQAEAVTVIEHRVPERTGSGADEPICLITTVLDAELAPAAVLAAAYHQRWEQETGNDQLKTPLRGPGRVLRSKSPERVSQEIWAYLLTHHAVSALICQAASAAAVDPDRVKFGRAVRIVRRSVAEAFSPDRRQAVCGELCVARHLNPRRRHRPCPRVVKRARHSHYPVKRPTDVGVRHTGSPTIRLVNLDRSHTKIRC